MVQRAADSAVLTVFSLLYSCAVFVLKRRTRPAAKPAYGTSTDPQRA
jgi:hypothetical protein